MADRMNALPKYVVSDRLTQPLWNNSTAISRAEAPSRIHELKQTDDQDIVQYGFGPVAAMLLREGLLDELRIWLHPLLVSGHDVKLGDLLAGVGAQAKFGLADVKTFDSGLVILSYQPQPTA
jgi:dihydrofolate reductase